MEYVYERGLLGRPDELVRSEVIRHWAPFRVVKREPKVPEAHRYAVQREYGDAAVFTTLRSCALEDYAFRLLEQRHTLWHSKRYGLDR